MKRWGIDGELSFALIILGILLLTMVNECGDTVMVEACLEQGHPVKECKALDD